MGAPAVRLPPRNARPRMDVIGWEDEANATTADQDHGPGLQVADFSKGIVWLDPPTLSGLLLRLLKQGVASCFSRMSSDSWLNECGLTAISGQTRRVCLNRRRGVG